MYFHTLKVQQFYYEDLKRLVQHTYFQHLIQATGTVSVHLFLDNVETTQWAGVISSAHS